MRNTEEISMYKAQLDEVYLSREELMTDIQLHNVIVKIEKAVKLFKSGLDKQEIKKKLKGVDNVPISNYEKTRAKIQRYLIGKGLSKGSNEYKRKEDKLLLDWAKKLKI